MRALERLPTDSEKPWYVNQRVGVNTLKVIVPDLTRSAGLQECYTNHCLRATGISRMYSSGVPEKLIAETSGHKSIEDVRAYH